MAHSSYQVPVAMPYVSGQEGVGVVTDAAPTRRDLLGKRVATVCIQPFGSLAPVSVGISTMFEVPDSMSDEDTTGFMIPAHTAWHTVHRHGHVQPGVRPVGVLGAAGGLDTGRPVVRGHRVATWSRWSAAEKAAVVEELGPRAVDQLRVDAVEGVRAATGGRGLDVLVDPVQGEPGARLRDLLVPDGRHVLCGHAGGLIAHDPHFYVRNHTLVGATLAVTPAEDAARPRRDAAGRRGTRRRGASAAGQPDVDFADVPHHGHRPRRRRARGCRGRADLTVTFPGSRPSTVRTRRKGAIDARKERPSPESA